METKEAMIYIKAIEKGLHETGKDSPYRDELIPKMKEACNIALKALEKETVLDEVIGLTDEEFGKLCEYYYSLEEETRNKEEEE